MIIDRCRGGRWRKKSLGWMPRVDGSGSEGIELPSRCLDSCKGGSGRVRSEMSSQEELFSKLGRDLPGEIARQKQDLSAVSRRDTGGLAWVSTGRLKKKSRGGESKHTRGQPMTHSLRSGTPGCRTLIRSVTYGSAGLQSGEARGSSKDFSLEYFKVQRGIVLALDHSGKVVGLMSMRVSRGSFRSKTS